MCSVLSWKFSCRRDIFLLRGKIALFEGLSRDKILCRIKMSWLTSQFREKNPPQCKTSSFLLSFREETVCCWENVFLVEVCWFPQRVFRVGNCYAWGVIFYGKGESARMDIFHFREGVFLFCLFQEWENFAADKEAFSVYEEISHGGYCETYIVCYAAI